MLYKRLAQLFRDMERFMEREAEAAERFTANLDELRKKGEVTEETETVGDTITKRIHFKSFDGQTQVSRVISYNKDYEVFGRMRELRREINRLLSADKFEEAIPLRDELRKLEAENPRPQLDYGKQ